MSDYWLCVTRSEIWLRARRILHSARERKTNPSNQQFVRIGHCRLVTWRHFFDYIYRLHFYMWQLTQSTITCDVKIASERTTFSMQTDFCISNVNYVFNICLLIFVSASFFVNEESHEQCMSFLYIMATILVLYFYLFSNLRHFSWMKKATSSACQTQLAAVLNEQQFVNEWLLTLARKICSDSVHHTPSCGNQNIRL